MELAVTGMTDRQRRYRANYRERVAGWYNGWLHVFIIYAIGFTALYVYLSNLSAVAWWEWLAVPVTFLFCNFFDPVAVSCDAVHATLERRSCTLCRPWIIT